MQMASRGEAMRLCKTISTNIWPVEKFRRLIASAGLVLIVSATARVAKANDAPDLIPVSMNAGETYVISYIKPGTKPLFHVEQNPDAFVSYDSPPGKLTMLSAEAGRWTVTI